MTYVSDCGTTWGPVTGIGCNMQYDTWYSVEMEVQNNTDPGCVSPNWGTCNGAVRVWVNGQKVYDHPWNLNCQYEYPLKYFIIGQQVDRTNWNPVDEYRYWDDIVLSTSYVGP
jgi:hypothetical protein